MHPHLQFPGQDRGQRGLPQARRAVEQHMVERVAPAAGGFDADPELVHHGALPDELGEPARPQTAVELFVLRGRGQRRRFH